MALGETPEFNKKVSSNGRSNEFINNSIINEFKSLESEHNLRKENSPTIGNTFNDPTYFNPNNSSAVSYKSVQNKFEGERSGSFVFGKGKIEERSSSPEKNKPPNSPST